MEYGPLKLPDGRLVCRPHGLVVCGYCCVDYGFKDEAFDSDDSVGELERLTNEFYAQPSDARKAEIDARRGPPAAEHAESEIPPRTLAIPRGLFAHGDETKRGTGRVFPSRFGPPSAEHSPSTLFPPSTSYNAIPPVIRYIRRDNPEQVLFYTDGACSNNGQANPKAGWAFVLKPDHTISGRLEQAGPFGDPSPQTSNRAELRAVLAVLRFRHWRGEGFKSIVFATDSEYVAEGATQWVRGWVRNGWKTSSGKEVKNKDLWEMLLGEVERWDRPGVNIQFWRIPRELNLVADRAAKQASMEDETPDTYLEVKGVLV